MDGEWGLRRRARLVEVSRRGGGADRCAGARHDREGARQVIAIVRQNVLAGWALLATLAVTVAPREARSQGTTRRLVSLDDGWEYAPGSSRGGPFEGSLEAEPASVTVPHTWNAIDALDLAPGYRRSVGFYRRSLDLRGYPFGARFILYFEGANTVAEVRVNGRRAGGHVGGYVGFEV